MAEKQVTPKDPAGKSKGTEERTPATRVSKVRKVRKVRKAKR
jgi:hypothetical protein